MSHLGGGTGFLGLGHGGWAKVAAPVAAAVGTAFLGPEVGALLGPALGLGTTAATAVGEGLVGAGLGAASSAATGGQPLTGALLGGAGGALGGAISGGGGIGDLLGSGSSDAAGAAGGAAGAGGGAAEGVTAAGGVASTAADTAEASLASPIATASTPAAASAGSLAPTGVVNLPPIDAANLADSVQNSLSGGVNNVGLVTQSGAESGAFDAVPAASALGTSAPNAYFPNAPTGAVADVGAAATPAGSGLPTGFLGTAGGAGNPELSGLSGVANPTGVASLAENTPQASVLNRISSALGLDSLTNSGVGGVATKVGESVLGGVGSNALLKTLGIGAASTALAKDMSTANNIPGLEQVQQAAQQAQQTGTQLSSYLETGTLPPQIQASVDQATKDGITAIKARFAQMGVAPGSSQERQAIAQLQQNAAVQGGQLASQLLSQGLSQTQLSAELYKSLTGINMDLNKQTGQAITNLATALGGGGKTNIVLGGTVAA